MAAEKMTVTVKEAAELLGVSRPTVYTLMHRADFPVFHVGRRTLISREGLHRWIIAQTEGGEAAWSG